MDLNHRPPGPEPGALARLRYAPNSHYMVQHFSSDRFPGDERTSFVAENCLFCERFAPYSAGKYAEKTNIPNQVHRNFAREHLINNKPPGYVSVCRLPRG